MVKHTLREGSSTGQFSQVLGESERLSDWQVTLHNDQWGSRDWFFTDHNTSSLGQALVNSTHGIIWGLNFAQEDWLLESWFGSQLGSVQDSSGSGDDLTSSSVDGISV